MESSLVLLCPMHKYKLVIFLELNFHLVFEQYPPHGTKSHMNCFTAIDLDLLEKYAPKLNPISLDCNTMYCHKCVPYKLMCILLYKL